MNSKEKSYGIYKEYLIIRSLFARPFPVKPVAVKNRVYFNQLVNDLAGASNIFKDGMMWNEAWVLGDFLVTGSVKWIT